MLIDDSDRIGQRLFAARDRGLVGRAAGEPEPFLYVGSLEFVDWWGQRPVYFTWRLRAFPNGLGGNPELDALAEWKPRGY